MTKSQIFKTAWALAKQGAAKFGGSSKEYFAEALKVAYQQSKGDVKIMYTLQMAPGSRKHKSWVAKIDGVDPKWGFKRTFINAAEYGEWDLQDGIYNLKDGSKSEQQYILVVNGEAKEISKREVLSLI